MKRDIGIIGLGNPLRHDDGIGLVLLDRLIKDKKQFGKNIIYVDGGTGGMNLLHVLSRFDVVFIIDAVDFKGKPGDTQSFSLEHIQSKKQPVQFSTHESDFTTVLGLSKQLNELPERLIVFGVQPYDMSYGTGLSKQLLNLLDEVYSHLKKEIKTFIDNK
jgi:hydrogenase maturation protease